VEESFVAKQKLRNVQPRLLEKYGDSRSPLRVLSRVDRRKQSSHLPLLAQFKRRVSLCKSFPLVVAIPQVVACTCPSDAQLAAAVFAPLRTGLGLFIYDWIHASSEALLNWSSKKKLGSEIYNRSVITNNQQVKLWKVTRSATSQKK